MKYYIAKTPTTLSQGLHFAIKRALGLLKQTTYFLSLEEANNKKGTYFSLFMFKLLHSGLAIKVCLYDESDHIPVHTEEKIFYTEDDYREYLARRGYTGLRDIDGYRNVDNMDDLRTNVIYRGVS